MANNTTVLVSRYSLVTRVERKFYRLQRSTVDNKAIMEKLAGAEPTTISIDIVPIDFTELQINDLFFATDDTFTLLQDGAIYKVMVNPVYDGHFYYVTCVMVPDLTVSGLETALSGIIIKPTII